MATENLVVHSIFRFTLADLFVSIAMGLAGCVQNKASATFVTVSENVSLRGITLTCFIRVLQRLMQQRRHWIILKKYNNNSRFDTHCISVMRIQSAVKCHCYLTQKQHTTVMQPAGAVPLLQHNTQYRNTRHNDISLLWPEREIVNLFQSLVGCTITN
jgi:hypothetical protein